MKNYDSFRPALILVFLFLNFPLFAGEPEVTVLFRAPARSFTESLPLGNGRLGALVYGNTSRERIA
ncbi:MAG: glycoside hydrolase family 95 protein, partial [Leadbetterella sp.]|nr:glycoside hydrolase family 95 protein [Leadbetterella sp.]